MTIADSYERPAVAGSGTIACGLAACASMIGKVRLLARSDASAWRAEESAQAECAKLDGADARADQGDHRPGRPRRCDLIVEAMVEDPEAKAELLATLGDACPDADLATTTSSLSIAELGRAQRAPGAALRASRLQPGRRGWS